jgi:hypothetical protein
VIFRFEGCGIIAIGRCSKSDYYLFWGASDVLPAGDYRAYVFTETGHTAKATLEFPSLSGNLTATADNPAPYHEELHVPTSTLGATTSFGTTGRTDGEGLVLMRLRTHSQTPSADRIEVCTYYNGDEQKSPDPFGLGCESGLLNTVPIGTPGFPVYGEDMMIIGYYPQAVRIALGGNVTTGGLPAPLEAQAGFFSYDSQPPGSPAPDQPQSPSVRVLSAVPQRGGSDARGMAKLTSMTLRVRGQTARALVACADDNPCRGEIGLDGTPRLQAFALNGRERAYVRIHVPASTLRQLVKRHSIKADLLIRSELGGVMRDERRTVRLVTPKRRSRTHRRSSA